MKLYSICAYLESEAGLNGGFWITAALDWDWQRYWQVGLEVG